jgi:Flp pilus assembly protein TadG
MMSRLSCSRRALRDGKGLAAVEFALIAPMLAFVVVSLADATNFAAGFSAMQRAERAGVQYFMNGGTNTSTAQAIVTNTWSNPPSGYTVTTAKVCTCSNGLVVTCVTGICAVGSQIVNMTITASATIPGMLMSLPESKTESVRVQ